MLNVKGALVLCSAFLWLQGKCGAFVVTSHRAPFTRSASSASTSLFGVVSSMSLEHLDPDHEVEGTRISASIVKWLDTEWMPQTVHVEMAESAKQSYVTSRTSGETDVMGILLRVAEDLERDWPLYDKDAFNNAWDIGNYVSDYIASRGAGIDDCKCNNKIY
jgi:hypothetical protein|mmetsp:Transcript_5261/g.9243  ORF Transcript_5261/g.9243 Transcript_5261/m.9243 type:complete len:162 (-) Transcript_5261:1559-2044(-)